MTERKEMGVLKLGRDFIITNKNNLVGVGLVLEGQRDHKSVGPLFCKWKVLISWTT